MALDGASIAAIVGAVAAAASTAGQVGSSEMKSKQGRKYNTKMFYKNAMLDALIRSQAEARQDTAMQRTVEDYKKAGISPILAANGGQGMGSITASTSRAPVMPVADHTQSMALLGTMMGQMSETVAQIDYLRSKTGKEKAQTELIGEEKKWVKYKYADDLTRAIMRMVDAIPKIDGSKTLDSIQKSIDKVKNNFPKSLGDAAKKFYKFKGWE